MGCVYNLFVVLPSPLDLGKKLVTHSQAQDLICTDLFFFRSLLPLPGSATRSLQIRFNTTCTYCLNKLESSFPVSFSTCSQAIPRRINFHSTLSHPNNLNT